MTTAWTRAGVALFGTMLAGGPSVAADDGPDVPVGSDLAAVIALQGLPCGRVVSARQQAENDYRVSCQDGHAYRVFVNAEGRVVVEKR